MVKKIFILFYLLPVLCFGQANRFAGFGHGAAGPAFKPTDLSNLILWICADSLTLSDGDPVGTWRDLSGLSNDLIETANKPTFRTSTGAINGKPIIEFVSASSQQLLTPANFINSTTFSIFAVFSASSTTRGQILGGDQTHGAFFGTSGSTDVLLRDNADAGLTGTTTTTTGVAIQLTAICSNGTCTIYKNGTSIGTGTISTMSATFMGRRRFYDAFGPEFSDMKVAETIIFSDAKSADRITVENYQKTKYGL